MCTSVTPRLERFAHRVDNFVNRVFEGVSVPFFGRECTELAREDANVGVIDVAVVNVGREVAVLSLANGAGHDAKRVEIIRTIQFKRVRVR